MKFAVIALLLAVGSISHADEFKLFSCAYVGPVGESSENLDGVISRQSCEARNQAEAELKMAIVDLGVNAKGQIVTKNKSGLTNQIVTSVGCVEMK